VSCRPGRGASRCPGSCTSCGSSRSFRCGPGRGSCGAWSSAEVYLRGSGLFDKWARGATRKERSGVTPHRVCDPVQVGNLHVVAILIRIEIDVLGRVLVAIGDRVRELSTDRRYQQIRAETYTAVGRLSGENLSLTIGRVIARVVPCGREMSGGLIDIDPWEELSRDANITIDLERRAPGDTSVGGSDQIDVGVGARGSRDGEVCIDDIDVAHEHRGRVAIDRNRRKRIDLPLILRRWCVVGPEREEIVGSYGDRR
jgi:hypothetical protein